MPGLETQDISQLSKEGARMEIIDVNTKHALTHAKEVDGKEEEFAMYLTLKGPDSPDVHRELANIRSRAALLEKGKGKTKSDEAIENDRQFDSKLISRLVVGGEVFLDKEWKEIDNSNAYDVMYRFSTVRGQALNFCLEPGNFTKG